MFIYYQNVNGLLSKLSDVFLSSFSFNVEVLCLTETNLNSNILDAMILCNSYVIYRCDRTPLTSNKISGGGCLIAVLSSVDSEEVEYSDKSIEFVCVKIKLLKYSLFICCVYIAPALQLEVYNKYVSAFLFVSNLMRKNDKIIILGDFNLPKVKWQIVNNFSYIPYDCCNKSKQVFEQIFDLGLFQHNFFQNSVNNVLDLVFSNCVNLNVLESKSLINPVDVFHPCLQITFSFEINECSSSNKFVKDYKKTNMKLLTYLICSHDWSTLFNATDANYACNLFYKAMYSFLNQSVPLKKVINNSDTYAPWENKYVRK